MVEGEEEGSSDEETSPRFGKSASPPARFSGISNPKYFLKLGFMKNQMKALEEQEFNDVAVIIDGLIEKIKID